MDDAGTARHDRSLRTCPACGTRNGQLESSWRGGRDRSKITSELDVPAGIRGAHRGSSKVGRQLAGLLVLAAVLAAGIYLLAASEQRQREEALRERFEPKQAFADEAVGVITESLQGFDLVDVSKLQWSECSLEGCGGNEGCSSSGSTSFWYRAQWDHREHLARSSKLPAVLESRLQALGFQSRSLSNQHFADRRLLPNDHTVLRLISFEPMVYTGPAVIQVDFDPSGFNSVSMWVPC